MDADTEFGPQFDQQAWSQVEDTMQAPQAGPPAPPERTDEQHERLISEQSAALFRWLESMRPAASDRWHSWRLTWGFAGAILTVAAVVTSFITLVPHIHSSPPPPPPPAVMGVPWPPPPRIDLPADFDKAFTCNGASGISWTVGGADYYGGPPHGATPSAAPNWQPQMLLKQCPEEEVQNLYPLGVTVVRATTQVPGTYRVRYFITQTLLQSEALQAYLREPRSGPEAPPGITSPFDAMVINTGFCVQPDTRCERDY
jgi:hypothetical protein